MAITKLTADSITSGAIASTPAFEARNTGGQSGVGDAVWTKMTLNSETYDTDNAFDSSTNYRFTPQTAGKYFFYTKTKMQVSTYNDLRTGQIKFYKNGSLEANFDFIEGDKINVMTTGGFKVVDMNGSSDYVEAYFKIDGLDSTNISTEYNLFGGYKIIE